MTDGTIRTLSRIDRTFFNIPTGEARPCTPRGQARRPIVAQRAHSNTDLHPQVGTQTSGFLPISRARDHTRAQILRRASLVLVAATAIRAFSEHHSAHAVKVPNHVFLHFPPLFLKLEAAAERPPDRSFGSNSLKKSNTTSHSCSSNNSGNTQHQATTVPSSYVPERTLSRIDARASAQQQVTGSRNDR